MILYTSTRFSAAGGIKLGVRSAVTGQDGMGYSIQMDANGDYTESGGMGITTNGARVGGLANGQNAGDPFGPYHQPFTLIGTPEIETDVFCIAFCNTADSTVANFVTTSEMTNGEETDWYGNGSGAVGLHTPNLTDDVYTLVVPTCNPLRQATTTRNGNSIVFHIPQNSLAVYAINANLETSGAITSGMTDAQASQQIIGFGYGLILKTAGTVGLFNVS